MNEYTAIIGEFSTVELIVITDKKFRGTDLVGKKDFKNNNINIITQCTLSSANDIIESAAELWLWFFKINTGTS